MKHTIQTESILALIPFSASAKHRHKSMMILKIFNKGVDELDEYKTFQKLKDEFQKQPDKHIPGLNEQDSDI